MIGQRLEAKASLELLNDWCEYVDMTNIAVSVSTLIVFFFVSGCSSVQRSNREPSGSGAEDGETGTLGKRGRDGQSGKAFFITTCDGLIQTAVYRASHMRMWQEDLQDMCSVRPPSVEGLAKAHEDLDAKIERLFATGYLGDQEVQNTFGEIHSTELEKLTLKMAYVNDLNNKVASKESVDFGCHPAKIENRHKEIRNYNVCMIATLAGLSRDGDVSVDLRLRAFEVRNDGKVDTSASIIERVRLQALPSKCEKGIPVFQHSSMESNGTQFRQTIKSNCESFTIDSEGVFPPIDIRFE